MTKIITIFVIFVSVNLFVFTGMNPAFSKTRKPVSSFFVPYSGYTKSKIKYYGLKVSTNNKFKILNKSKTMDVSKLAHTIKAKTLLITNGTFYDYVNNKSPKSCGDSVFAMTTGGLLINNFKELNKGLYPENFKYKQFFGINKNNHAQMFINKPDDIESYKVGMGGLIPVEINIPFKKYKEHLIANNLQGFLKNGRSYRSAIIVINKKEINIINVQSGELSALVETTKEIIRKYKKNKTSAGIKVAAVDAGLATGFYIKNNNKPYYIANKTLSKNCANTSNNYLVITQKE